MEDRVVGVMRTPDGYWTVEVVRVPLSRQQWYRVKHGATVLREHATIGEVERMLGDQFPELEPGDAA
jgi:hypothetical protein